MSQASWAMTIVQGGAPQATIVIAAEANDKVKTAAEDLQTYIEKMSGARLPLVTDQEDPDGPLILVGGSRLTRAMEVKIPSGLTPARREEGFVIDCRDDRLLLAGNDEWPYHGTQYAVYDFLNRLGVRWFMPGEYGEVIPQRKTITVGELNISEQPSFVNRAYWLCTWLTVSKEEGTENRRWMIRNKMSEYGMFGYGTDGSLGLLVPRSRYYETHPEYYAMDL
ncbi:MAG: hypothetical protein KAW89_05285, partial [Armatimonadetes bacterium]|nr:hypothetical protein [Armatimonadota bacterium]